MVIRVLNNEHTPTPLNEHTPRLRRSPLKRGQLPHYIDTQYIADALHATTGTHPRKPHAATATSPFQRGAI